MRLGDYIIKRKVDPFEKLSKDILSKIKYKFPSEIDIYHLCDLYGIKVDLRLIDDDEIGATYAISHGKGRRGAIHLCVCETEQQERITLAHEFSHIYIHHLNQLTQSSLVTDKMERQAFKLASNILMPAKDILEFEINPDLNTAFIMADSFADHFNVTVDFAYERLVYFNENYKFNRNEPYKRIPKEDKVLNPDIMFNKMLTKTYDRPFRINKPKPLSKIKSIKLEEHITETKKIVVLFDKTQLELK